MRQSEIPIASIRIPDDRARATFTEEQEQELRTSIQTYGFNDPILVREIGDDQYELIDGEHRIQIWQSMGHDTIPATISEVDGTQAILLNFLANTARGSQNPMDVAEALHRARDHGVSDQELAAATGHTLDWVRLYLTIVDLPDTYKDALRRGELQIGHVREAARLPFPVEVDAALQSAITLHWNVKTLQYYVNQRLAEIDRSRSGAEDGHMAPPPTVEHAENVVMYGDCMMCRQKVPRLDLSMPTMCPDCRTLLSWILENLGDPKEAMKTLYNALTLYFDVTRREALHHQAGPQDLTGSIPGPAPAISPYPLSQNVHSAQPPSPGGPGPGSWPGISPGSPGPGGPGPGPGGPPPQPSINQNFDISEEDLRLLKFLRAARAGGLI